MKRTKWFPATVYPARHGWYEVKFARSERIQMRWFNGIDWLRNAEQDALISWFGLLDGGADKWRGLTEKAS
jgi:hypothetical protein